MPFPACNNRRICTPLNHKSKSLIFLGALLLSACGVLTEVPENIDSYPDDFEQFLRSQNAHTQYEDLVYFLASQGVHNIVPIWQLLQQGSDWRKHRLPKYAIPPRKNWDEIVTTLVFLKYDLIPYIGPVKVLSGFRTPHYNFAAGGAGKSRHLSFSALDLRPVNKMDRSTLHGILQNRWKQFGHDYKLGLGLYNNLRFHIDTGGHRQWNDKA